MQSLAASTLARGGDRNASRLLWKQMYDTANNDYARNAARTKLQQLDAIEIIERLQQAVDAIVSRTGGQVTDWGPLITVGHDSAACRSTRPASRTSSLRPRAFSCRRARRLFPLPIEPGTRSGA